MPRQVPTRLLQLDDHLFRPGQRIAIAVSGGADSVALLRALLAQQNPLGLVLSIAHVHHGIRGNPADHDQSFVESLAAEHNLPIHLRRVDTPARAAANHETIEQAARTLRYAFFHELLEQNLIDAIATAHTLDDQAETVLHKLIRGGWTEGLGAISPILKLATGTILRPLLHTTRSDIETYLQALNQPWCEDATNQDTAHTRNRIRHELLPSLRSYNPQIAAQLSRLSAIARDEEAYWQREVARIGPSLVLPGRPVRGGGRSASTHPEEASLALELERLRPLPPALQRRLLRWAVQQLDGSLNFEHTEALMHLCGFNDGPKPQSRRLDIDDQLSAQRTPREIQLLRRTKSQQVSTHHRLPIPGELRLPEYGLHFIAHSPKKEADASIRTVQPGDRVTPIHSSGPKKIKDVLERLQLSAAERSQCPVVLWPADGPDSRIIWLGGVTLDPASLPSLPFTLEVVPF